MRQWHAEETVDVERARVLIGGQFPELAYAPMELIGAGWDNTVIRVDKAWAFRFPRRAFAIPGVEREIEVLRLDGGPLHDLARTAGHMGEVTT